DIGRGLRVSEKLDFGMIGLNRGLVSDPAAPFGGMKQSGVGREGAHEGLKEFLETQYISMGWGWPRSGYCICIWSANGSTTLLKEERTTSIARIRSTGRNGWKAGNSTSCDFATAMPRMRRKWMSNLSAWSAEGKIM